MIFMIRKLKNIGFLFLFLSGAVGGGYTVLQILHHFSCPDVLCDLLGLVYFCAYCAIFSKVGTKEDLQAAHEAGYDEGYSAGHEDAFRSVVPAASKVGREKYDEGYCAGYEAGKADGWDRGFSAYHDASETGQ